MECLLFTMFGIRIDQDLEMGAVWVFSVESLDLLRVQGIYMTPSTEALRSFDLDGLMSSSLSIVDRQYSVERGRDMVSLIKQAESM